MLFTPLLLTNTKILTLPLTPLAVRLEAPDPYPYPAPPTPPPLHNKPMFGETSRSQALINLRFYTLQTQIFKITELKNLTIL